MSPRSRFSFFVFTLLLAAALLAGSFWLARAAAQTFPAWKFRPVASLIPPGVTLSYASEVGEQGELVVKYFTQTVETTINGFGLAFGGALTPIISEGQPAPGGGTFRNTDSFFAYAASPTSVYFTTDIDLNGETPTRAYHWNNGTLTHLPTQANESYDVTINDSHGKFVLRRTVSEEDTEYRITDGAFTSDPITLHNDNINDDPRTNQQLVGITADGGFLVYETISSGPPTCSLAALASPDQPAGSATTRLFWQGSRSGTIISGSYASNGCGGSGHVVHAAVMNSAGDVFSHESQQSVPPSGIGGSIFTQLIVYPANGDGPSVVGEGEQVGDVGPYFFLQPLAITEERQPIFSAAALQPLAMTLLYSGPNPATDQFDGDFFAGFGQDGEAYNLLHVSEKGYVIVQAQLEDDTFTDAFGSAVSVISWIDPTGGNWGDGANWDGGSVPGSTSETLFNLDAAYTVNVGTHDVGRVRLEDGIVTFENADLTLLGPLSVGNDAAFDLTSGSLAADQLIIGSLPPGDPANPPTAHVQISNPGAVLSATAVISIGHASPGSIFLDDARIDSGSLVIGENFPGSAALSGQHANWYSTGATAVGYNYTGTLSIESGAFMRSAGQVVIGQGNTLQEYTSLVQVRNFATPPNNIGTNWLLLDTLTIGNFLRGELDISHGGRVTLFGNDSILQAGLRAHPAHGFDAFIGVDGSADSAVVTSTLEAFNDVLLGMADEASVGVNVNGGGQFIVDSADLFLGFIPGSEAVMTVAGINPHGAPALVQVKHPVGSFDTGICAIGESGAGRLLIHSGGQVDCGTIRIGGQPGSSGFVQVNGANGGSTLTTEGGLCIGGDFLGLCGAAESGSQGTLELKNSASVSAGRGTLVGPGGRVIGDGDISVGLLGFDVAEGGVIAPGVTVLGAQSASYVAAATGAPGTLTIHGSLTMSETAQLELDLFGSASAQQDRLVVTGTAALDGVLALNFTNGYAPRQGDVLTFVTAGGAATGSFANINITGLEPGFEFAIDVTGGAVTLTALNDGVPTTSASYNLFLPLVVRP